MLYFRVYLDQEDHPDQPDNQYVVFSVIYIPELVFKIEMLRTSNY